MHQLTPLPMRIVDFYPDGKDARHYCFELLGGRPAGEILPGQFFMLTVPGAGLAPFTFTSLPDEMGRFYALVRKVGTLTQALFDKNIGDVLGYTGPCGTPWPIGPMLASEGDILVIAGGCGLAPLSALIDSLIAAEQNTRLTVIYGAHDPISQVLHKERERWRDNIELFESLSSLGDLCHAGSPIKHIKHVLADYDRHPQFVLSCGPEGMMHAAAAVCLNLGVPPAHIWLSIERRMRCGVGLCGHCYLGDTLACRQGPTYRYDILQSQLHKTSKFDEQSGVFSVC